MDLAEFLLARIAEDEASIEHMTAEKHRVETAPVFAGLPPDWLMGVAIFVSPDRWRAECEAKRRIIDALSWDDEPWRRVRDYLLELLALPYADHPDYRAEWKP
jgi:hypothetical protein